MHGTLPPYAIVALVTLAGVLALRGRRGGRPAAATPRADPGQATTYECGVDPVGEGWAQTQIRYYLYAYLYVIFAVDAVYLFPGPPCCGCPASVRPTLAEMGIFLGVLAVGLLHAWRRGLLRWV